MTETIATTPPLPATQLPEVEMQIPQGVFIVFLNMLSREWINSDMLVLALMATGRKLVESGMSEVEAENYIAALQYHVTAGRTRAVHEFVG